MGISEIIFHVNYTSVGPKDADLSNFHSSQGRNHLMFYCWNGRKYKGHTQSPYGAECTEKDVVGLLIDMDAQEISFTRNGINQGAAFKDVDFDCDEYYPIVSLFDANDQVSIVQSKTLSFGSIEPQKSM